MREYVKKYASVDNFDGLISQQKVAATPVVQNGAEKDDDKRSETSELSVTTSILLFSVR